MIVTACFITYEYVTDVSKGFTYNTVYILTHYLNVRPHCIYVLSNIYIDMLCNQMSDSNK